MATVNLKDVRFLVQSNWRNVVKITVIMKNGFSLLRNFLFLIEGYSINYNILSLFFKKTTKIIQ